MDYRFQQFKLYAQGLDLARMEVSIMALIPNEKFISGITVKDLKAIPKEARFALLYGASTEDLQQLLGHDYHRLERKLANRRRYQRQYNRRKGLIKVKVARPKEPYYHLRDPRFCEGVRRMLGIVDFKCSVYEKDSHGAPLKDTYRIAWAVPREEYFFAEQ